MKGKPASGLGVSFLSSRCALRRPALSYAHYGQELCEPLQPDVHLLLHVEVDHLPLVDGHIDLQVIYLLLHLRGVEVGLAGNVGLQIRNLQPQLVDLCLP